MADERKGTGVSGDLERLEQVTPLGAGVSYNNASLSLAGRVIEKVTGTTYEKAVRELLLVPLGLSDTWFSPGDIISRRFAVGHTRHEDGRTTVARPWAMPRSAAPAGGISATAADQISWARFHLDLGVARDGSRVLGEDLVARMQQPTADMRGSALGDAVGISWLLKDLGGLQLVGHGGTTNGQYSSFSLVPERGFAVISMANSGPHGSELNHELELWAFEHFLGIVVPEPEQVQLGEEALAQYVGHYDTIAASCVITADHGRLSVQVTAKPRSRRSCPSRVRTPPTTRPSRSRCWLARATTTSCPRGRARACAATSPATPRAWSTACTSAAGWRCGCASPRSEERWSGAAR